MFDFEIAFYLYKMAAIHSALTGGAYRAKAYFAAAMAIDSCGTYASKMYHEHRLQEIQHIGAKTSKCIAEIIENGSLTELNALEKQFGIKDYTLLLSNGLSDEIIKKLWNKGFCTASSLVSLPPDALDKRSRSRVLKFIENGKRWNGRHLFAYAERLGSEIICFLKNIDAVTDAYSIQNITPNNVLVSRIEIAFCTIEWNEKVNSCITEAIKSFPRVKDVQSTQGNDGLCVSGNTLFGIPFVLFHKEKCTDRAQESRDGCYNLYGDLHTHTQYSDGIHSIEEMAASAEERGYEYIAITDHSVSEHQAGGLSERDAMRQIQEIRNIAKHHKIKVLSGIEVDILRDGNLDYCDEALSCFDVVVAAVHNGFEMTPFQMKNRLKKALSNPYVDILAHPTTRLLGRPGVLFSGRDGYNIDELELIDICRKNNVALEVNCFPERMDIDGESALKAANSGVMLSLGTDAHSLAHLCNIKYGADMLASCKAGGDMVLNTRSYGQLSLLLAHRRKCKSVAVAIEKKPDVICAVQKGFEHYFGSNAAIMSGQKRVIGIDLTGSENKESGWALMTASRAECRRIKTDAELIASVENAAPDAVSIDSPLAFPTAENGIMRQCERLLASYGIPSYPCMIDSMKPLTKRGSALAQLLRNKGYCVIESYPGAAQDIMSIPRKGKTYEQFAHLKRGIASFGVTGDILDKPGISHDEVDAITSALVGYFYLTGKYIGLGNDTEGRLIVPRVWENATGKNIVIGLAGETASGKTTTAGYLQFKYGFGSLRYSNVIAELYGTDDKKELQRIGAKISCDADKQRELSRCLIAKMDASWNGGRSFVVDGLRHMEDYEELSKRFGKHFVLIYINCRYGVRCARYIKAHKGITEYEFSQINRHPSEKDIPSFGMKTEAINMVSNNKGFKDLWEQIDKIVARNTRG